MQRDEFRTVVKALITHQGRVLIGQKERREGHPISGEWHVLGGHVTHGENVEAAARREVEEETGLDVTVGRLVDVMTFPWGDTAVEDSLQILYHCEAESTDAEAGDDLRDVRWVRPDELSERLFEDEAERLATRPRQAAFLAELERRSDGR